MLLWGLIGGCATTTPSTPPFIDVSAPIIAAPAPLDEARLKPYSPLIQEILTVKPAPHWSLTPYGPRPNEDVIESCQLGHQPSCLLLGWGFENGDGIPRDPLQALSVYFNACNEGMPIACFRLGVLSLQGSHELPSSSEVGIWNLWRGCRLGDTGACSNLTQVMEQSPNIPNKAQLVKHLHQRSCSLGSLISCEALAVLALREPEGTPQEALERASGLLRNACWRGHFSTCWRYAYLEATGALDEPLQPLAADVLATVIGAPPKGSGWTKLLSTIGVRCEEKRSAFSCLVRGVALMRGEGVVEDLEQAARIFNEVCDRDVPESPWACGHLAWMSMHGSGQPKDSARSAALSKRSCDAGYLPACNDRDIALMDRGTTEQDPALTTAGVRGLREQCRRGDLGVCAKLLEFCARFGIDEACQLAADDSTPALPLTPHPRDELETLEGCSGYQRSQSEIYIYCAPDEMTIILEHVKPSREMGSLDAIAAYLLTQTNLPGIAPAQPALDSAVPNRALKVPAPETLAASARFLVVLSQQSGHMVVSCVVKPDAEFDEALCRARIKRLTKNLPPSLAANQNPSHYDFFGAPMEMTPGCWLLGPTEIRCERGGQMNWQVAASPEAAEGLLKEQLTRSRTPSSNAGSIEVLFDEAIECTIGGEVAECGQLRLKLLAPGSFDGNLDVYHARGVIRGEPGYVVCSFYLNESAQDGMVPLCSSVFEITSPRN